MKRTAGILLNVSSFPGKYGIGGFSCNAEHFLNEFAGMGFGLWQTLPITALGGGASPYSGISSYAGNYLYIDLERLDGLLTKEELAAAEYKGGIYLTDYAYARETKTRCLKLAYSRVTEEIQAKIDEFKKQNEYWLLDYVAFMTLKVIKEGKCWPDWGEEAKYTKTLVKKVIKENKEIAGYFFFEQYYFYKQWTALKAYANNLGIKVFGDLPIYVCLDSVEVWVNKKEFLLDSKNVPIEEAGVPPDYFSEVGQLWGNPLYNYEVMKKNDYKWWTDRIIHSLKLYDVLRIDHFRGLYEYWAVPYGEETAKNGKWKKGPDMELFEALYRRIPKEEVNIIAEDLGILDDGVDDFLERSGFPGMRVIQFAFDGDKTNRHLPHNYKKNMSCYTSTHDNDTTLGWLLTLGYDTLKEAFEYVDCDLSYGWADGAGQCRATRAFIKCLMQSVADVVVIPMQDLCGYGNDTRMNLPGTTKGCWEYRTNYTALNAVDHGYIRHLIYTYGRK